MTSTAKFDIWDTLSGAVGSILRPARQLLLIAGLATANGSPLKYQSGALRTTPEAGDTDYDGKVFFGTPNATSRRGVNITEHMIVQLNDRANIASDTSDHAIFDAVAGGTLALPANMTYMFEMMANIYTTGTTARLLNLKFITSQNLARISYMAITNVPTSGVLGATSATFGTAQTAVAIASVGAAASYSSILVKGTFRTNLACSFCPTMAWGTAPGQVSVVRAGSYFRIWAVGEDTMLSCGAWS
jgi:hypothetical protein